MGKFSLRDADLAQVDRVFKVSEVREIWGEITVLQ